MSQDQKRAEAIVEQMLAKDEFSRWLGIEVLVVKPASCICRMTVRDEMVNGFGVAHGGIVFSLADSAFAFASNTQGRIAMSIENGVTYPAPVHPGDRLTAEAHEESASNRLAFYRVQVTNQHDAIVGIFRGTVYKTKQEHP
ncbi:MAG: hydroxyphenylacetyl-CoA thioesterase PaaI [Gemmatimonadales bacterium]|nr:hydroxyphenylacetyl-CoA thioesterase PaaI [Gemmatimonadales bacterium]